METERAILSQEASGRRLERPVPEGTYESAVREIVRALVRPYGPLLDLSEVGAVGHRVVHGGDEFLKTRGGGRGCGGGD